MEPKAHQLDSDNRLFTWLVYGSNSLKYGWGNLSLAHNIGLRTVGRLIILHIYLGSCAERQEFMVVSSVSFPYWFCRCTSTEESKVTRLQGGLNGNQ